MKAKFIERMSGAPFIRIGKFCSVVPVPEAPYPPIVSIPLDNTILLLDSLGDETVVPSPNVLFSFDSSDIDRSFQHLLHLGNEVVGGRPERFSNAAFITFKDPDGHLLMTVQEC